MADPVSTAAARADLLDGLGIMDTPSEREFDTIVQCAQRLLNMPIALISLVDDRRQWFKAVCGIGASGTAIEHSLCAHALQLDDMLVIPDLLADPRFADHPSAAAPLSIRFYAGTPIRLASAGGEPLAIGTLCVIDLVPRVLSDADAACLQDLAHVVESLLAARASAAQADAAAGRAAEAEAARRRALVQADQAARVTGVGAWRLRLSDNQVEWSDQVFRIYDLEPGAPPSLDEAVALWSPADRIRLHAALAHAVATGEGFDVEATITTAAGRERRVRSMGDVERARDGTPLALIGVFQDVTEPAGQLDDLTRLAGAAGFDVAIDAAIAAAQPAGRPLALALVDVDDLRAVNDRCGHLVGDEILRGIAAGLTAPALAGSFAARLAGDEFVLILSDPELVADLAGTLNALLARVAGAVAHQAGPIRLSATIGAAWLADDIADGAALLAAAEDALRIAKRTRRGAAFIRPVDLPARAA